MSLSRIKVQLAITKSFPVLLTTLGPVSEDHRPDRLRSLALMGLHIEKGTAYVLPALAPTPVSGSAVTGELNELSFFVVLNGSIPSLYADIQATPARLRADRLRLLASLGAAVESGRVEMRISSAAPPVVSVAQAESSSITAKPISVRPRAKQIDVSHSVVVPSSPIPIALAVQETNVLPVHQNEDVGSPVPDASTSVDRSFAPAVSDRVGKSVRRFSRLLGED